MAQLMLTKLRNTVILATTYPVVITFQEQPPCIMTQVTNDTRALTVIASGALSIGQVLCEALYIIN